MQKINTALFPYFLVATGDPREGRKLLLSPLMWLNVF